MCQLYQVIVIECIYTMYIKVQQLENIKLIKISVLNLYWMTLILAEPASTILFEAMVPVQYVS